GHHVECGRSRGFAEARPARRLVAPRRLERLPADTDVANATPTYRAGIDRVGEAADAHHVAALAVVRIAMEEVVGHVLHHGLDLGARHLTRPRIRVRERGVRVDVLERDRLPGNDGDAPAES